MFENNIKKIYKNLLFQITDNTLYKTGVYYLDYNRNNFIKINSDWEFLSIEKVMNDENYTICKYELNDTRLNRKCSSEVANALRNKRKCFKKVYENLDFTYLDEDIYQINNIKEAKIYLKEDYNKLDRILKSFEYPFECADELSYKSIENLQQLMLKFKQLCENSSIGSSIVHIEGDKIFSLDKKLKDIIGEYTFKLDDENSNYNASYNHIGINSLSKEEKLEVLANNIIYCGNKQNTKINKRNIK